MMSRLPWRWILSGIGALLIAVLVWVFGPLLAFLEDWIVRSAIVAVIVLVWFVTNFLIGRSRRKKEAALVEGATSGPDPSKLAADEEAAKLRERLSTALGTLAKARGTRGYLYEQPWYVIIGPPGAGKTTALLNAGLKFPLAAEMGQGAVAGAGGTRMCDWWFTDEAVMIDTAGRYTTQDSDQNVDKAGWDAFLDSLKRSRPRQPLNGVLVAIGVPEIASAPQPERLSHARAIRKRVKELTDRLGVKVPVYLLLTKADLLRGFTEYFDDLDRDRRAQVWGVTFPAAEKEPIAGFGAEFKALLDRVEGRVLDRLQAERNPDRRTAIAGFPTQLASLEAPLNEFLTEAFGGSRLDPAPFLRGVYFASGTQEGTPIDRLTGVLARGFGIDQRRAPALRPESGRSYFLERLLKEVVFGEAMLGVANPAGVRCDRALRAAAWAGSAILMLGGAGWLWLERGNAESGAASFANSLAAYEQMAAPALTDPVNDGDLARIAPMLDAARALPAQAVAADASLGMSQSGKLAAAGNVTYRHAVQRALLPRLLWRLETQMRGAFNQPDLLYEATRIYLMLGSAGPLDRDLVREWMALDWANAYPGAPNEPLRQTLDTHLVALLANPLPQVALDGALVEEAQRAFSRIPLAERVYSRIRPSGAAVRLPPWRPGDAAGAAGARLFIRGSGKPLTEGIPGFYTVDGFHRVLLPSLPQAARDVAGESWVLGQRSEIDPNSPAVQTLERDVVALYVNDYVRHWEAMLADLNVVPLRNLPQAVQDLFILGAPQSPMRDLLVAITRQLTLSVSPVPPAAAAGGAAAAAQAVAQRAGAAGAAASRLSAVLGQAGGPPQPPPGIAVDERYEALRELVGSGPGAPLDNLLALVTQLQQQLAQVAAAQQGGAAAPLPTGADPIAIMRAEASRQPEPVARWLTSLASNAIALRGGGVRAQAAAAWNGGAAGGAAGGGGAAAGGISPAQLCRQAVEGRFPFRRGAPNEIPMDDFARLFAPGGMLDSFFNTQLRPFVDMSGRNWRPQALDGVPAPVSADAVANFQRAAVIRDIFFAGGPQPGFRFDIAPAQLDAGARQATLDLDGVVITYAHGPTRSTQVTWPGANRMANVRLVFDPAPTSGPGVLQASGPWALLRLFQQGQITGGGAAERFTLSFRSGERSITYDIRASSTLNPLASTVLQEFRCPAL
ncbi:MAG TPA: type VI secretion system membrane subunit TssM [Falsiroseomonas sp.]|jgi:type VI secretion system protein ImpL|nr:type VI secretion system membrane subunit TssM [Falsiroseomonas sp.]